jgi:ABC-type Fe3+ transport system permease subunit
VFVHLMSGTLAINIMLLVPAFRAMDNALAESSHTLGASRFTTLRRVIIPSLLPTIGLVTLLSLVRGVDAFEADLVVGAREQIDVLGTIIFADVVSDLPRYGNAAAPAPTMVVALIPFIALQR